MLRSNRVDPQEIYPVVPGQITEEDVRLWRRLGILPKHERPKLDWRQAAS